MHAWTFQLAEFRVTSTTDHLLRLSPSMDPDDRFDEGFDDPNGDDIDQGLSLDYVKQGSLTHDTEQDDAAIQSNVQEIVGPLQQTADRVTRQIEEFAKCLDQFNTNRTRSEQGLWDDAFALLENYNAISLQRASKEPEKRQSLHDSVQAQSPSGAATRRTVELEADIWALMHDILVNNSPDAFEGAEEARHTAFAQLHQYSTNADLWTTFLDSDPVAAECEATLSWLQDRSEFKDLEKEIQALTSLSRLTTRGDEIYSAGPLYTKNSVKNLKRASSWHMPLDAASTKIRDLHIREDDGERLTYQLDPDAETREKAVLALEDEAHERASWQACWEMVRRGVPRPDFEKFWNRRNEMWRFAVLRANDPFLDVGSDLIRSPWLRIINGATNDTWFELCKILAQSEDQDPYRQAVYGLLSGQVAPSLKACGTVDDFLYAITNATLVSRFRTFVSAFRQKQMNPQEQNFMPEDPNYNAIDGFLNHIQSNDRTSSECLRPFKYLQARLFSKQTDETFLQFGTEAARVSGMRHDGGAFVIGEGRQSNQAAHLAVQDADSVRMIAHLQLVLKALGYLDHSYEKSLPVIESNIVNYISVLHAQSKWNLIPLYASKLSATRIPYVLGSILLDVSDPKERSTLIRLLKQYDIEVSETIYGIYSFANTAKIGDFKRGRISFSPPKITELKAVTSKFKVAKLRSQFMDGEIDDEDDRAIRSVEWYRHIDPAHWGKACYSISTLFKIFLYEGKFAAARDLVQRASLMDVSLAALGLDARFAEIMSPSEAESPGELEDSQDQPSKSLSPSKKKAQKEHFLARPSTTRAIAASQAIVWYHLEQLVIALSAFADWIDIAEEVDK